ncbi:protein gar2 [Quercus suber]|uniref:protein gar2 n=1 Tax=Quercus suber TaxID=58331 RepID=UPI0032DE7865
MGSVDDQTFNVNFTTDGVGKLREVVKEKLMEFTDFSDDHLVEYVIVLVKNGKRKEDARNELRVFLDGDTDSFVSWLWDHLALNLDLYVQHEESYMEEAPKTKPPLWDQGGKDDSHRSDSESEKEKSNTLSRSRHNREWKGLVRDAAEPPPLRSSDIDKIHYEEKPHRRVSRAKRSPSPRSFQRKRSQPDERESKKREAVSQVNIDAPRRLLQFAVRDAVGTSRPSNLAKEPRLKRLRSVVSTSTGDSSFVDHPQRIQSVARVLNPMSTVIKAVAEAAEDVIKVKPSGSVFDRLGRGMDVSETSVQHTEFRDAAVEDGEYGDVNQIQQQTWPSYHQRSNYSGQYVANMTMLESETGLASDSTSDNEGYDDVNVMGRRVMDVSQTGTSAGSKGEDSMMVQYSVANNADDVVRRNKDHDQAVAAANTSRSKIVNISVNVNTWKPPHYQEPREIVEVDNRKSLLDSDTGSGKSGMRLMTEPAKVGNGNAKPAVDAQKESLKTLSVTPGLYAAGRPLEDADSRTIFISNVHFGASKDSLSRHFNKFGEVLKVVILTDAATGQPKGSAYVEFMRKEAADNALSLDGTSFMSRILKVVRRSAANQEAAPIMTWPRANPFAAARFARVPFPRGMSGAFRARPPLKLGARSMQWKRDAQATPAESGASVYGNAILSPTARSLTYVRTEPKPDGNPSTT